MSSTRVAQKNKTRFMLNTHLFQVLLFWGQNLSQKEFYFVVSHHSRPVGLILIKFTLGVLVHLPRLCYAIRNRTPEVRLTHGLER
jgi:hypothetical protein